MKKTVLHDIHVSLKARMAPFGGYDMPIQYEGIIAEHKAAREGAALFDTCHMGEFKISGVGAVADLERILSCDVADIKIGACRYGFICNDDGGIIDDQILYRIAEDEFMMVVNAATEQGDFEWMASHVSSGTSLKSISQSTAKIDVQGPKSPKFVASLLKNPIGGLKFYNFSMNHYRDWEVIVSRTGYTGEIGFEIYCPVDAAIGFWNDCMERGATPAGLGARDVLRLEMGFPLYGHELSASRNAAQSDYTRAISAKKEFIGSTHVLTPSAKNQLLRGISLEGRRTAREGDIIADGSGSEIGMVTSGGFSPSLGHAVAMGYVNKERAEINTAIKVISGKNEIPGAVCETPFYKNATARKDILLYL